MKRFSFLIAAIVRQHEALRGVHLFGFPGLDSVEANSELG